MKVIFDFDDTIFDTESFKKNFLFKIFQNEDNSLTPLIIEKDYSTFRLSDKVFNIDEFVNYIISTYGLDSSTREYFFSEMKKSAGKYIFTEYKKLIRVLGKRNVVILSEGEETFQKQKISLSGITSLVSHIEIVDKDKSSFLLEYCKKNKKESIYFVDNKKKNFIIKNIPGNLKQIFVNNKAEKIEGRGVIRSIRRPLDFSRILVLDKVKEKGMTR